MTLAFTLFSTRMGVLGIAWTDLGVCGVQLPEESEGRTRARLLRRYPQASEADPPAAVFSAVTTIQALLGGEPRDLLDVPLDLGQVAAFNKRVYEVARAIRPGNSMTYGAIAAAIGQPNAARAVGQALGRNPAPILVPCHRVVGAAGRLGGFSARGGSATKARLLEIEARHSVAAATLFDELPWAVPPVRRAGRPA